MNLMRIEKDAIGRIPIDEQRYYGIHSHRAKENFDISGNKVDFLLIKQLARIKAAAAVANEKSGGLSIKKVRAICLAAQEIIDGKWQEEFLLDAFQGGAGTSTNMNVNEVIANRGLEIMGYTKGDYEHLHPLDDVNRGQSTNDVYPSAGRLTTILYLEKLEIAVEQLMIELQIKAQAYVSTPKMGRTQLQEAVPTTFGAGFAAYASNLARCKERIQAVSKEMQQLNLGGTAIGNGLNANPVYQTAIYQELNQHYSVDLRPADNLIDATQNADAFAAVSGVLKTVAISLTKISHDLRLLSSGPRSGFRELNLAPRQAGSSIMPGKVNPVIPEVVSQIAFQVVGNDAAISLAAASGELELNAFEPVIFHNLFESCQILTQACSTLATKCIADLTVNAEKAAKDVEQSTGVVTELAPLLGYEVACQLVKEALAENVTIDEMLYRKNLSHLLEKQA